MNRPAALSRMVRLLTGTVAPCFQGGAPTAPAVKRNAKVKAPAAFRFRASHTPRIPYVQRAGEVLLSQGLVD